MLCRFIELLYERQGNSVVIPAATQQAPINIPAVSAHTASTLLHAALRPLYSTAYTLYASTHSATVSKYASIGSHRVMVSFGVFKTIWISACPTGERLSRPPPDPPRPRGRATPAPHGSRARCYRRKNGPPNAKHGEREASKGALPGTACSVLGKRADPLEGRVSNIFTGGWC